MSSIHQNNALLPGKQGQRLTGASGSQQAASTPAIPEARRFGRYELLMEMAKGGMATLYLARISGPEKFEKLMALKRIHEQLSDEEQFTQMFLDEARLTARIHHPNVASVFDMGKVDGSFFIAMEYIHGQNLNEVLRAAVRHRDAEFNWFHAMRIVADAAAGLHAAHELKGSDGKPLGVVHRDVSPQNILISYDGNVKVVDFGIAFAAERLTSTATGTMKGKAAYMSPEQVMGRPVDRRSDIFALGTVLWESVLKRRLFREELAATSMMRIRDGDVPSPRSIRSDLPAPINGIIMKALAYSPGERYQTMVELEDALNRELIHQNQYVAHGQLAKVMEKLLYDRKRTKDEQIQIASQAAPSKPIVALGMGGQAGGSSTALNFSSVIGLNPLRRGSLIGLIVGGLVTSLVVLVIVLLMNRDDPPAVSSQGTSLSPARDTAAQTRGNTAIKAVPQKLINVRVVVTPVSSSPVVVFQGKRYNGTQVHIVVRRAARHEPIQVTASGFHPSRKIVDLRQDSMTKIKLRSKLKRPNLSGRRGYRRRRGRPPPRPSTADWVKHP